MRGALRTWWEEGAVGGIGGDGVGHRWAVGSVGLRGGGVVTRWVSPEPDLHGGTAALGAAPRAQHQHPAPLRRPPRPPTAPQRPLHRGGRQPGGGDGGRGGGGDVPVVPVAVDVAKPRMSPCRRCPRLWLRCPHPICVPPPRRVPPPHMCSPLPPVSPGDLHSAGEGREVPGPPPARGAAGGGGPRGAVPTAARPLRLSLRTAAGGGRPLPGRGPGVRRLQVGAIGGNGVR